MIQRVDSEALRKVALNLAANELKQPLHTRVRQILREQILNDFQHNQRFYSERDLILTLKVSQPTIRRALNDLVSEGHLKRVWRQGSFVQKLTSTRYVGLIHFATEYQTAGSIANLSQACLEENLVLNVYYLHPGETVENIFQAIRHPPTSERIIMTGLTTEFTLQMGLKLQSNGYSHLVIGPHVSGFSGSSLSIDYESEVDQVLDHLMELGHKRIAFIVNEPRVLFITSQRAEAVRRKLEERKLTESSLIFCDTKIDESSFDAAYNKTEEIWRTASARPTAIVPLSGIGGWAVLRYAVTHRIDVPKQLSIVCFDPIPSSDILPIPLTELQFSHFQRAKKALEMLWKNSTPVHDVIRSQLIPRRSTGPAPS